MNQFPIARNNLSSFVSYAVEKKVSKTPEEFGASLIEGVAAPESAYNSAAQGAFIPLLTLGIPSNDFCTAVILSKIDTKN